jgi:hypothetical protein
MFAALRLSRLVNQRTVRIGQRLQLVDFIIIDKTLIKTLRKKLTTRFVTAHFFPLHDQQPMRQHHFSLPWRETNGSCIFLKPN